MEGDWSNYWRDHPQNPSPGESNAFRQGFSLFTQESNAFQAAGANLNPRFAAVADPEPDVEEIASMPASHKRSNYYPSETVLIFRLYLEHTHDSVVGVDQKWAKFWGSLCTEYNAKRPQGSISRDVTQIKSHFQRVAKDSNRFEAMHKKCHDQWKSGMNDGQITEQAEVMWLAEFRVPFRYPHAWKILRESKRDKGKGKKKAEETSEDNKKALGYMANMVDAMEKLSQVQRDLADSTLMSRDTSQMNSDELAFHMCKVAEIKQRNNIR